MIKKMFFIIGFFVTISILVILGMKLCYSYNYMINTMTNNHELVVFLITLF